MLITGQYKGVVESLNFPNTYPSNSQCNWTIQGTRGNNINYTFTAFDLESSSSSCSYDYVKVHVSTLSDAGELLSCCLSSTLLMGIHLQTGETYTWLSKMNNS